MTDLGVPFEKAGQPPNGPLVSIIVRTMGRAELGEALASLAVQTGTRVEVVVVDARGTPPVEFPAACGRFPVRVVHRGRHLGRSAAANAGLEEVTGDLLGFLDEDDLVDADHLDRLVRELVAHPDVTLAYAGVRTSTDGLQGPLDLNRPFDHLELMRGNFIPIHAALFRRRPVDEGCRFDEGLDAFEDWDFWLQLAERGPFLHVDRVSATYRVGGGSLIGLSGSDEERARGRASVYEKWKVRWSGEQIAALMQVPHSGTEKATGAVFDELRDHEEIEQQLQQRAAELDAQLRLLLTSWSWRLSRGLRELGLLGRRLTGMASGDHAAPFRQVTAGTVSRCFPPLPSPRVRSRPLISVVLPVYNACRTDTRFLSAAIESVARQTYPNLELLVIDDGSSDASAELCGALLARYPQLPSSLLRKQNGGQSSARNVGIARARGEWVSFIDQDDVFLPDKLTTVSRYLGGDVGVVYTDADTIGPDGRVQVSGIHRQGCGRPHPKRSVEDILFRDVFVMPGVMTVRRSLLNQVGGFDEELSGYEDDDLFLRLYLASPVVYLPVSTLLWRMHEHNYSQTERMLHSRSRYAEKLLAAYAAGGADTKQRERGIARRFYTEFLRQAAYQFRDGVAMYRANIAASRGLRRYLPLWDSTIVSLRWLAFGLAARLVRRGTPPVTH